MKRSRLTPTALAAVLTLALAYVDAGHADDDDTPDPGQRIDNEHGMSFVAIPAGTFEMGSPTTQAGRDPDETAHEVTLSEPFYMQTTEVTRGQWKAVMGTQAPGFKECGDDCPVERVKRAAVERFIAKLSESDPEYDYRLPTEAEWEYAARAGTSTAFNTGECLSTDQANIKGEPALPDCEPGTFRGKPVPVASFEPNDWGLYDMHGNVWEMCQDWYGEYPEGPVTDPAGPETGEHRVIRGGSWRFYAAHARSANRFKDIVDIAGFRLVLVPEQAQGKEG